MMEADSEVPREEGAPSSARIVAENDLAWVEELPPDRSEAFEWVLCRGRYPATLPPDLPSP
ncbi:MAG: hypothetical protein HY720_09235 [Planctomycetes bacterium]|nr:hypothetical protein [Planctomycetota bacterium]